MSKGNKKKPDFPFLTNLEDFDANALGNFENDPSLEAELLDLLGGGGNVANKTERNKKRDAKPIVIDNNLLNLDLNEDDNDGDFDENDPELLEELSEFLNEKEDGEVQKSVPVTSNSESVKKLEKLKDVYQEAIKQASNDPGKSRRYDRSLKLINELLSKAAKGIAIDEAEFPPMVPISSNEAAPTTIEPPVKTLRSQSPKEVQKPQQPNVLDALIRRQMEYKSAALENRSKDMELAKGLMVVVKQFDEVIKSVKAGEPFDIDDLPPPPSEFKLSDLNQDNEEPETVPIEPAKPLAVQPLGEELKIRLAFYKDSVSKAKAEGNESKARRIARVVQQYEEANEAFKKRKPFAYEELPPPPGRPPLSIPAVSVTAPPQRSGQGAPPTSIKPQPTNAASKVTQMLIEKQAQFKAAALKAKNEGDLPLAKELLRQSMGMDKMVQASQAGLPIDLSKLPTLPTEMDYNFQSINVDECEIPPEMLNVSKDVLFKQLQITLLDQIKMCKRYENAVTIAGDIIGAKRFEGLAKSCEQDLNGLKCLVQKNAEIPRFHYEYRSFSVVHSNPDLAETDMSVEIVRAMNLGLPSGYSADQFDTYVVVELPFPNDSPQTFTTETVRKTNSPVYNSTHKFQVNLKSRVFQRVVKNKPLKADIFYRKGFLQKDKLYGSCVIKLEKLETACSIHESFDIVENRKVVAGKLELKIRIRNPVSGGSHSEHVREKWLVIDDFNRSVTTTHSPPSIPSGNHDNPAAVSSIDVLKFEIGDLRRKMAGSGSQMSPALATALQQKIAEKESIVRHQEEKLKSPDPAVKLAYLQSILRLPQIFNDEAKKFLAENQRDKAQISITKKKLVEKEIEQLKQLVKLKS